MLAKSVRRAAEAEASKLGASVSFEHGTRHVIMTVVLGPHSRRHPMTRNTKGSKAQNQEDWVRQDIRKYIKEIQSYLTS